MAIYYQQNLSITNCDDGAPEDKVAAEVPAPLELVGHVVVGEVPSGVLHERHGDPRVDGVLGVRPGHRLVLEQPLLPVRESRPLLALVLQLRPGQSVATVMPPNLQMIKFVIGIFLVTFDTDYAKVLSVKTSESAKS